MKMLPNTALAGLPLLGNSNSKSGRRLKSRDDKDGVDFS
jgi:hypothetical protein